MTDLLGTGVGVLDVSAGGVVVIFVLALLTGRLVPKSTHEQALADLREARDAALADLRTQRDAWREAHTTTDARADVHTQQLGQMLEYARTSTSVIQALGRAANATGGSSGTE